MLTPEGIEKLRPKFEAIRRQLNLALLKGGPESSEEACGHYIASLVLMEELLDEVSEKEGHGVKEALRQVAKSANSAEGVGVAGGVGAAASALSFTGLGGFGLAAGGTAVGVSGLLGATVLTGGAGLAGAAALYLAYKGGAAALETEVGQKVADRAADAGKRAATELSGGFDRLRNLRIKFEAKDEDSKDNPDS